MIENYEERRKIYNERIDSLFTAFPDLLANSRRRDFSIPAGWHNLVYNLLSDINKLSYPPADFAVVQIKEKFGGLRFYTHFSSWVNSRELDLIISTAEALSYTICDTCGQPGTTKPGSWIRTMCGNCERNKGN